MRLSFVVQRYGSEVAGGAEALCRSTARALAERGDEVEVLTTTARDYLTWEPHYPQGTERDGAVVVRRFTADPPDPRRSAELVRLDFYYIETWSIWLDLTILARTIPVVLRRRGAY